MRPIRILTAKPRVWKPTLATLLALVWTLLLCVPGPAMAEDPFIIRLLPGTFEYDDLFNYCVPVHVRSTITTGVEKYFDDGFSWDQHHTEEFTNLNTGKTATAESSVNYVDEYVGDFDDLITVTGKKLIKSGDDLLWVQAGVREYLIHYDPVTDEETTLTIKDLETPDGGTFAEALCAALQ